ncbi:hypothetical protein P8452_07331 [Trifolium repens]|nr:hypothetical protein P8452_07331 [Trifolium repens]
MNGLNARFGVLLWNVVREKDGTRSQSRHGRGTSITQAPPSAPPPPPPPPSDISRCHEEEEAPTDLIKLLLNKKTRKSMIKL